VTDKKYEYNTCWEIRIAYGILVGISHQNWPRGRRMYTWKDNSNMDILEIRSEVGKLVELTEVELL
jgi:hypothetical protein